MRIPFHHGILSRPSGPQLSFLYRTRTIAMARCLTTTTSHSDATVRYEGQTPLLTLTVSNGAKTAFRISPLKPVSVLLEQIKEEDPNIKEIAVYDLPKENEKDKGFRWARSTQISHVLSRSLHRGGFVLLVNNTQLLHVHVPTFEARVSPLRHELESVENQLVPLRDTKKALDEKAHRSSVRIAWLGLGALCAQWGIMARLTWWEYSWDVMEPISYFIGAGTGILGYMFYVVTSKEYTYEALAEVTATKHQIRLYKRKNFDLAKMVELERRAQRLRLQIEVIRKEYQPTREMLEEVDAGVRVEAT
ncbi:uncharacterized protein SPPG_06385 [Spizellomyces punctatus DAOM BR117]|uniref:Calcium uniporter protein, mitochondrial n=1 Tax=Spizellomyces punctatus (strain DAOM BR117) TaxID=645134 RepID=A0A0L0HBZ1_SPIPD|nr:uncharacterized protein SPPG_06385 [Spizellomyces punctatus DAOM BR117]KNC98707.1 hypothetical protein SPPG_06385 [Spizellomyces punctatus DAOM BR117]|eukprot:XP_016606747.1 hypothetical protein SPPG_06385 [Spizellomyces punctatus DAOM BR117]